MWQGALDDDVIKFFVDIGTQLVKWVDNLGLIKTLVMGIGTILIQKNFKGDLFGGLFSAPANISEAKAQLQSLQVEYEKAQQAYDANHTGANKRYLDQIKKKYDQYDGKLSPILAEHDELTKKSSELTEKLDDLQVKRKSLVDQLSDSQANEDFLGKRMATGYDGAAEAMDKARVNSQNLQGQIQQLDQEIVNTKTAITDNETALRNVETQAQQTGIAGATAGQKIKASFKSAGKVIKDFGKQIAQSLATMYVITTILELIIMAGHALEDWVDSWHDTPEELQEKFEELNNELSKTKTELRNLESELDKTNDRIEELMDQGTLTFVEQEELTKLKETTAELERQIALQETLQKSQQQGVNAASIKATDAYLDTSFMSDKTKTERQEEAKETGSTIGKIAGGIIGASLIALGVLGEGVTFGTSTGLIVLGASMFGGGMVGSAIGSASAGAAYDSEQTVEEAMNDMLETRAELKKEQDDALTENDVEAYNKATEALRTYDEQMAKHISQIQQNYNAMDWTNASPEDRKEMMEYADWLDKYSISMGTTGAKSNAIARIFGDEAEGGFAKAKAEIDTLKKNLAEAQKSGEGVDEALAALEGFKLNLSPEEVARLREMGIYLYEVEDYFKNIVKTESEFVDSDLEDVAKDINKITDGLDSLKTAFDEVIDKGVLTAKTVLSIKDALGIGDSTKDTEELTSAWREYLDVMMSGTATTEEMIEATERLAQEYIEDALASNALNPETKYEYIAQLRSLGVTNADEYVDDLLQKNMVEELENKLVTNDEQLKDHYGRHTRGGKSFDELTDAEKSNYAKAYGLDYYTISDDTISAIKERYGVEGDAIDGIIDKLNEKAEAEREIQEIQRKSEAYNDWYNGDGKNKGIKALEEDISELENNSSYAEAKKVLDGLKQGKTLEELGIKHDFRKGNYYNGQWYDNNTNLLKIIQNDFDQGKEYLNKLKTEYNKLLEEGFTNGWVDRNGNLLVQSFDEITAEWNQKINDIKEEIDNELTVSVELDLQLQDFDTEVDKIQDAYSTLKNIATEYNSQGYLSLDNLQALLSLSPEYLAVLKMENGQITINQQALEGMLQTKLAEAEATAVQTAITQLSALAERKQAIEISNSAVAANQASIELGTYSSMLGTVAQDAIVAAGSVTAFNNALRGAQDNAFVSDEEINQILSNFNNSVDLINSVRANLPSSFNNILDPGSKTSPEDVAESEWDRLVAKYENQLALITNERDLIEAEIDKAEARGGKASAEYYEDLIRTSAEEKTLLEAQYTALSNYLEANKDTIDQDTWTEYNNTLNDVAVAIKECETNTISWQEALREIDIHYFEQATDEISRLGKELEFVDGLLEDEDVADENGNWSSAALTRMAMYTNLIEKAATDTQRYQDEIAKLEEQYKGGELSEEQYQDRLATLTDGLYDSIDAQNDARDSIIELNEARIETIKEGIEKEIEAYEDLIDVKKEELDAERDLYDFRNNIKKQTKDISELERRIASLSGSSAASDVAERRRLEAQLMEAKEGLNDTYYDHSYDTQSRALDDESEAYRESQEKRIEKLEETLDNVELLIQNSMMDVLFNADIVYNELNTIADTYGITLSDELTQPWKDASTQAMAWKDELKLSMTSGEYAALIGEGGAITVFANGVGAKLSGSWNTAKTAVEKYSNFLTGTELGNRFSSTITGFANQIQKIIDKWNGVKTAADNAYQAQLRVQNVGGNPNLGTGGGNNNGSGYTAYTPPKKWYATATLNTGTKVLTANGVGDTEQQAKNNAMTNMSGVYYDYKISTGTKEDSVPNLWNRNKKDVKTTTSYYAKGTTGTTRDEWAITDEPRFGEELVLVPGKDGNLSFMRKGTGVVPADLTANLMEWGQFTPDSMNLGGGVNINMINNAVNRPEFNLNVDNFLRCDNVSQDSLPELKHFVKEQMDSLVKQMNYSIKRFSR